MREFYVFRGRYFVGFFLKRGKLTIKQTAITRTSYTSGPSLKIKIIVIRWLFSVRCPEIVLLVQYILPTCINNRASIVFLSVFMINISSLRNGSLHSPIWFLIATHDRFQNSSSGFAEMIRVFLYQRNMKKAYACYNIKYFNCI